jgi:hypothetical protein
MTPRAPLKNSVSERLSESLERIKAAEHRGTPIEMASFIRIHLRSSAA